LYKGFLHVSGLRDEDGLIDVKEFKDACGWEDCVVSERIFHLFDQDNNGQVDFKEFVEGLAIFSKGTDEQKIEFSFRLYDLKMEIII